MDVCESSTTPIENSQQILHQLNHAVNTSGDNGMISLQYPIGQILHNTSSEVMVTPSSSTSVRKRRLVTSETQLNDPSFRNSCKRRFLQLSQNKNSNSIFAHTPLQLPGSIDLLRNVVRDELHQNYNQDHQRWQNDVQRPLDDSNQNTVIVNNIHDRSTCGPQSDQFPRAHHYVDDDELYDLLMEMEQEFDGSIASSNGRDTTEKSPTVMSDWEEEMYFMTVTQHEDDAVQEQIMDYYNQE